MEMVLSFLKEWMEVVSGYILLLWTTDMGLFTLLCAITILVVLLGILGLRLVLRSLFRRKGEKERMFNHLMRVYTVSEMQRIFFRNMKEMIQKGVRKRRITQEEADKLLRHFSILFQQWDQCPKDPVTPPPDPKELKASLMEKHKNSLTEKRKRKVKDIDAEMQAILAS